MNNIVILVGLIWLVSANALAQTRTIVLTYFDAFAGRGINQTEPVAKEIKSILEGMSSAQNHVILCKLPVVYDQAAQVAEQCLKEAKLKTVDLMISLGEGGCDIRLESAVSNLDHTTKLADNAGVLRAVPQKIQNTGPERVAMSLPIEKMYCGLSPAERKFVRPSVSAGNFVCNNTAYHLGFLHQNQKLKGVKHYGFIHIPHSQCPELGSIPIAQIIGGMVSTAFNSNTSANQLRAKMPKTQADVKTLLKSKNTCEQKFWESLSELYP